MGDISIATIALESETAPRLPVGSLPCQGSWYRPADGMPRVAFIAAHYSADMSGHFLGERIASRGYGFLGWNTRYRSEELFAIEHALIDVGAGMRWLKDQGVETIALLGNSGGGSLMAAYQSQAVARPLTSANPDAAKALAEMIPGDVYISLNAHAGRPEYITSLLDPSVVDDADPASVDPDLDMFDPRNGPPYSTEFLGRYREAQAARNRRITAWAIAERERLRVHGIADRIFSVPRVWADPRFLDPAIDPSDRMPGKCYAGDPRLANRGVLGVARATSIATWLSMWSLDHSQCRAALHLPNVTVPSLVIQTTDDLGVFPEDARAILALLAGADKQLVLRRGAHFLETPADARDVVVDLMASWLHERGF